jgi:membrane-bound metal-dependent hydrolase YbcI (DUF457 family)
LLSRLLIFLSKAVHEATKTGKDKSNGSGHRALTHTLLFCGALGGLVSGILHLTGQHSAAWLGLPIGVGALAHLLGDACTVAGIPLLFPFSIKGQRWYRVGLPKALRLRTDGWVEHRIAMPTFVIVAGLSSLYLTGLIG